MGGGVSVLGEKNAEEGGKTEPPPSASVSASPSASGAVSLPEVVVRVVYNTRLKNFVKKSWSPSSSDDPYFQEEGKTIALNVIDFIAEATDFKQFPKSGFQYYRACNIFEKYLMRGASRRVPLNDGGASSRIVDECSAALYGGKEEQSCNKFIFAPAVSAAMDFLVAEVFPDFELKNDIQKESLQLVSELEKSIQAGHDIDQVGNRLQHMEFILNEDEYIDAFLNYCARINDPKPLKLLEIFRAITTLTADLSSLGSEGGDSEPSELNIVAYLHMLHGFYTAHLLKYPENYISSCFISDATVGDFLFRIAKATTPTADVLLPIEMEVIQKLSSYLDAFLESQEHSTVVDQSSKTFSSMQTDAVDSEKQLKNMFDDGTVSPEMVSCLSSQYNIVFASFLEEAYNELPLLQFCQSAIRYQHMAMSSETKFDNKISECTCIFERFLSPNATEQVKLPEDISRQISRNLFQPDATILFDAMRHLFSQLSSQYWKIFMENLSGLKECTFPSFSAVPSGKDLSSRLVPPPEYRSSPKRESSLVLKNDGKKYSDGIRLEDVLTRPQCLSFFKSFLDAEGTSQTLLFLTEVEEFLKIPEAGFQKNRARKIYVKFIHNKAIMAVPISGDTREAIEVSFSSNKISRTVFSAAVQEVKKYVESNQFSRFMLTPAAEKVTRIIVDEVTATQPDGEEAQSMPLLRRDADGNVDSLTFDDMKDLRLLLKHPTAVRYFKDFCVRTVCHENLYFWLDAENYAKLPGTDFRKRIALKLCEKYINEESTLQVNISGKVRTKIQSLAPRAGRLVFEEAQEEVFALMEKGTYPSFMKSKEFEQLKQYFTDSSPDAQ